MNGTLGQIIYLADLIALFVKEMDYGQKNKKETDLIRLFLSIEMSLSVSLITQNCFEKQIHRHRIHKQEKTLEVVMTSRVFGGSSGTHPLLRKVCRAALASACSHQKGPPDLSALSGFESLMQYSHAKQNSRLMATVCFGGSSGTRTLGTLIKSQVLYQLS